MRRREFIPLVGGAVAAWPLVVRAQQPEQTRRIGVLMNIAANDPEAAVGVSALMQALKERGWILGTNIQIDYRWATGDSQLYRRYAPELVALAPDVILVVGGTGTGELQRATSTIPIVFVGTTDPSTWFDCEYGSARRQYHRVYRVRVWSMWKVAGVTQADCT